MEETPTVEGQGLDYIINIDNGDFVRKLAAAIDSNNVQEKTQRLNQLKELCHHSAEGHAKVIQIIEQLRDIKKTRYCYGWLVSELNKAGSSVYRCSLLSLINSIINLSEQLDNRRRIRNELIGYRILDVLKDTRKECESDEQTLAELTAFEQSRDKDEEHLTAVEDVDLSCHLDVFYAIFKQVSGTPQEIQYLSILQHLLQIDTTDSLSDVIWENVDRFVTKAALVDDRPDAERLQVEAKRRLDRSVQSKANCDRNCQCVCHSAEAIETNLDNPLSPSFRRRIESLKGSIADQAPAPPPPPPPPPPLPPLGPRLSGVRLLPSTPLEVVPAPPPPPPPAVGPSIPRQLKAAEFAASSTLDYVDTSGGTEACALRLPQQQTPIPKWRMKKLQWIKIPASKVVGKMNVWTTVGTVFSNYSLNFGELEELFGISDNGSSGSAAVESKDPCVQTDKKKKSDEINLLDSKRSLNVNIFLRQFRISHAEIITCLTTGQGNLISPEKLRGLQKILPEQDDIEALKAFDGDKKKLGTAEKFYLELIQLPNYKLRTDALLIREEFVQTVDWIRTSIDAIILTAKDIKDNKSLLEIIFMVLMAGNFLNSGGYGGDAAGFKLASLLKLTETNSNKPGMTLLHYVVSAATQKNPRLLKLPEELKYLKEAAQYSVESLTQDIVSLRGKLKAITDQMPNAEESFRRHQMNAFLQGAAGEMENIEHDLKEMETLRLQLADYFCEEEKTFKLDECIKTFASFVDRFQKAIQENEQKEKAAQRKRQQDKTGARILPSDPTRVSPSPVAISKNAADDSSGGQLTVVDSRGRVLGPGGRGRVSASVSPQDWANDPLRASVRLRDRKSTEEGSSVRPRSLDEILCGVSGGATGGEDKRQRQSAEGEKNDLFNYLLQSEDTLGEFDRMGSLRKSCRRRPKTPLLEPETIGGSRERTIPSPSPVANQTPTAATSLEPNHKSWRTNVEKTSPLLEKDLIRVAQRHGVSSQPEINTRRIVSLDVPEIRRDNMRVRAWSGDNRNDSSNPKIIEMCDEIAMEMPKYNSGGSEPTSSADPGSNRCRRTTRDMKDLDYLICDLEQTGRDIERDLARESSVASSALRGEGDGAPQRPTKQENHLKIARVSDSAWIQTGLRGEGKEMLEQNGFSGWNSDATRSKASPMDDLKRRIADYKSHDATCESFASETKSRSRARVSDSRGPASQDEVRAVEHPSVTVTDEGVTPPEGPDSSPATKRWGRVFEAQTTDTQPDVNIGQYDHQDSHTEATETIVDQEPSAAAAAINDGPVDETLLTNSDYLRNERRARSAAFEVNTSGVKLRQESQRGSGTSINQTASSDNAQTTATDDQLATESLSSADDEGYTTMSNRSSTQTASIASFEEKLTESDNKMLSFWDRAQDSQPMESSPGSNCDMEAALLSSAPINVDQQGSAGGTEEPEESKTGTSLFARSIDSLVLKGELVPSGSTIDIDAPGENAPSTTVAVGSSISDACLTDDAIDTESQNSDQASVDSSQQRRFTLTREIRVPHQQIRSRASSQTRSPVPSKPQRPSVNDMTDRLSRPKKQTTVAAKTLTVSSTSVSSSTPPPKNSSSGRPDPFVRASPGRATMPASVFNANKKKAAAADHQDSAPVPPQRTTSIRASAASDRLSKGLPTSSSHSRRSVEPSPLAATTTRKSSGIQTGHTSVNGAMDDEGPTVHSRADKHHSSFIRKIVQKNPIRKAAAKEEQTSGGIQRPSKPGMSVSSRLSKA